jgi:hypothetical protein
MRHIAEFVAGLACALFSGDAVYLSLVEHPARRECGVELAATEFAASYRRATVMQASLARVAELEMELDGKKIVKYRATTKIYSDIGK